MLRGTVGSEHRVKNVLNDMQPGQIGKLQLMSDGTTKLVIGEVVFDVTNGVPFQQYQELVSVDAEAETFCKLGALGHRMVVAPDVAAMLPAWVQARRAGSNTSEIAPTTSTAGHPDEKPKLGEVKP